MEHVDPAACPPWGHIQYTQTYRPMGRGGYSRGMPCPAPDKGVAAGGVVTMDSEYFDGTWVIAYCACPHHASGEVVDKLRGRGFKHTAVLDEGILFWKQQGYPVTEKKP